MQSKAGDQVCAGHASPERISVTLLFLDFLICSSKLSKSQMLLLGEMNLLWFHIKSSVLDDFLIFGKC
jgi:hypothetical protein